MAEITHKTRIINLLPNKGDNILSQFLSWALNIGRLLVIITETLALSVFIYRFSIDMKLVDLHDKIENESIIISNFKEGEDTYRDIHARLAAVRDYDTESSKILNAMRDVVDMGKEKITFKSIQVTNNSMQIEVQAQSVGVLSRFTNELKNYPGVANLSVNRVENKTSSAQINVGISVELKT